MSPIIPYGFGAYSVPNWTGGVNAGFAPLYGQEFYGLGPFNNFRYSPTLIRDFNYYTGNSYTYNPRLIDNFNHVHNTHFDYAPEYYQNYNFIPTYSSSYRPTFGRSYNQFPPIGVPYPLYGFNGRF